jgi:outer membrane biosynthesis protein TonB
VAVVPLDAFNSSIRKPVFAALLAAVFALALGGAYAASSFGDEEKPVKPVGTPATSLDVPAVGAEARGLGEAASLPAMARKPKPPPPPEPAAEPEPKPVETVPEEPVEPEPVIPEPPAPEPVAPPPPPAPEPPPVQFDDEG